MNRVKFEYDLERLVWYGLERAFLKARGEEGWLLTAVLDNNDATRTYYFARVKEDS